MRIEFNGAVLAIEGFQGAFTLTVEGKTFEFNPMESKTTSPTMENKVHYYELEFFDHVDWIHREDKVQAIKIVREMMAGCGLGEAKQIVEGQKVYIAGPQWATSNFRHKLENQYYDTYTVTSCECISGALKFT